MQMLFVQLLHGRLSSGLFVLDPVPFLVGFVLFR